MRPNPVAPWELRISDLRAYYDTVEEPEKRVLVCAVGIKGTLCSVHPPRPSQLGNLRGMIQALSPACRMLALPILLNVNTA